jgi:predicted outer membrane repeat protein
MNASRWTRAGVCVLVVLGLAGQVGAETLTVRQDGSGNYLTIAEAIAAAVDGDVIDVGPGIYTDPLSLTKNLSLQSAAGSAATILDGGLAFNILWISGATCQISGFTFRNGLHDAGGAIHIREAAQVLITSCVFQDNRSTHDGGAVYTCQTGTVAIIEECQFRDNHADWNAGGCNANTGSHMTLDACTFLGNSTDQGAGAAGSYYEASMTIKGCLFAHNTGYYAGAVRLHGLNGMITNCTFHDNDSPHGASVLISDPDGQFYQNIVTADRSGFAADLDDLVFHDCNIYAGSEMGTISWGPLGPHEMEADPLFCNYPGDEYTLCSISPALPENNECGLIGAYAMSCTSCGPIGASPASWGGLKVLYR